MLPSVFCVGGVHAIVALPFATWVTLIANAGRDALAEPSLTLITMFEYEPTSAAAGVPESRPVDVEKLAQAGLL